MFFFSAFFAVPLLRSYCTAVPASALPACTLFSGGAQRWKKRKEKKIENFECSPPVGCRETHRLTILSLFHSLSVSFGVRLFTVDLFHQDLRQTLRQQLEATANLAAEGQGGQPAAAEDAGTQA